MAGKISWVDVEVSTTLSTLEAEAVYHFWTVLRKAVDKEDAQGFGALKVWKAQNGLHETKHVRLRTSTSRADQIVGVIVLEKKNDVWTPFAGASYIMFDDRSVFFSFDEETGAHCLVKV